MKKALYLVLILFCCTPLSAQNDWYLVYEHDENGQPLQGNIQDLATAIRNGAAIRIYFKMGRSKESDFFVEHTTPIKFTSILNSPEGVVIFGQIDPIVGQIPSYQDSTMQLKENLEWSLIASTTGLNDQMTRNVITGKIVNHTTRRWGTKWYASLK